MTHHKSIKIDKNKYQVRNPKRRLALNVYQRFCVTHHKGRWVVAFAQDESWDVKNVFKSNQTINRSQALQLIGFLSDYVNLVQPTEATALNASNKVSANRIIRNSIQLAGLVTSGELA